MKKYKFTPNFKRFIIVYLIDWRNGTAAEGTTAVLDPGYGTTAEVCKKCYTTARWN